MPLVERAQRQGADEQVAIRLQDRESWTISWSIGSFLLARRPGEKDTEWILPVDAALELYGLDDAPFELPEALRRPDADADDIANAYDE